MEERPVFRSKDKRKGQKDHAQQAPLDPPTRTMDSTVLRQDVSGVKRDMSNRKSRFEWDTKDDTGASRPHSPEPQRHEPVLDDAKECSWRTKQLENMTARDWRIFREEFDIVVRGREVPVPIRWWNEAGLDEPIVRILLEQGYDSPTPIQRQAMPILLLGRDMVGRAETGSGKTLGFVVPMLMMVTRLPKLDPWKEMYGPYGVVIVPTRELAIQIEQTLNVFGMCRCLTLIGGHSLGEQVGKMIKGVEIVIGTPGRLRECLDQQMITLSMCKMVVLDEGDRMVSLGFGDDMEWIMDLVSREKCQVAMFSATMSSEAEHLGKQYMNNPIVVEIGKEARPVDRIKQNVEMISEPGKKKRLREILSRHRNGVALVFVNSRDRGDMVRRDLDMHGYRSVVFHGGKSQTQREHAVDQIRQGKQRILVATDIAGRGIDIVDIEAVINYDMPRTIEEYIHRIGRTGRAGKRGIAYTFLTRDDRDVIQDLRRVAGVGLFSGESLEIVD